MTREQQAEARLKSIELRLRERGVRDMKFTPAGGWQGIAFGIPRDPPLNPVVIAEDLADLLEAYLDGRTVVVTVCDPDFNSVDSGRAS